MIQVPPASSVLLGLRFELFDDGGNVVAALWREDVQGATCPRPGDSIGRGSLGPQLQELVGLDLTVHHVDHYFTIPGVKDEAPLAMVVIRPRPQSWRSIEAAAPELRAQGWSLHLF